MKIYVDEIPKDCEECELNCGICCGATMNDISEENKKYCPLKSLAEHDKQVRKEVCEEFVDKFMMEYTMGDKPVEDIIYEVKSQIQGDKVE